jgi:hypothetical protein
VGTKSVEYCREIESYLCRKNDGHLIRVVGPTFELVSGWEARGIPLKVAFQGIDRYFERYYRNGPRRRPVRIDFCEADVLDVFDEWRRALGLVGGASDPGGDEHLEPPAGTARHPASLPEHLQRVITRLTSVQATGAPLSGADTVLDRLSRELDSAKRTHGGVRGEARRALLARLDALDAELLAIARGSLGDDERRALLAEADDTLLGYRGRLSQEAYERARASAFDRLLRERRNLPTLFFR